MKGSNSLLALQESWKTLKRTLMSAALARVPPGCRKHVIVGNDGHDVNVSKGGRGEGKGGPRGGGDDVI